jgi:hypothetical protein
VTLVLVPSTLLLLPEYAGQVDPVPELRSAVLDAVAALGDDPVTVVTAPARPDNVARGVDEPAGTRIARHLLAGLAAVDRGYGRSSPVVTRSERPQPRTSGSVLVVANGSACRTEKAPGHLDERAEEFDATIEKALRGGPPDDALALTEGLATDLWCHDLPELQWLVRAAEGARGGLTHAEATHGVAWWVGVWETA